MGAKFRCLVCGLCFTLVGCPGPGDRSNPVYPAKLEINDGHVCIKAETYVGEYIYRTEILSSEENESVIRYSARSIQPEWALTQQCLPTYGFTFLPGRKYLVAYAVSKEGVKQHRIIEASFTIP
ncbi:putative T6SS immunity periplasmic lipoprotein [Pantoea sp. A4]|uniref:putative T6SS immunity periplasmic lipoprotein n=1 Tax=Pantoea sp. A4 TaxID=1225184 RepID=UPI003FCD4F95